jgi:hypothetical protein
MQQRTTELTARLGYAARGLVYLLVGSLALLAAFGGGKAVGTKGALAELLSKPFGAILLGAVAGGFVCFAAWRLAQALLDADHLGTGAKAMRKRAARLGGAIINLGLAGSAISLIFGAGSGSDDGAARDWTAYVLSAPFGQWLVGLIGLGVAATGIGFAVKGWTKRFQDGLALDEAACSWVVPLGRFGYIARGVLFVIVGGFLVSAAVHANAREAKGLAGALQALQQQPYGWALLAAAAAGLFAFGAFMLVVARYRRIDAPRAGEAGRKLKRQARKALAGGKQAAS